MKILCFKTLATLQSSFPSLSMLSLSGSGGEALVYGTLLRLCVGRFLRRGQGADLQGLARSDEFQTRHESSLT